METAKKKKYTASDKSDSWNRIRASGRICTFNPDSAFVCSDRIFYGSQCSQQPGNQPGYKKMDGRCLQTST